MGKKVSFSQINFANASFLRSAISHLFFPVIGKLSRFLWRYSKHSKSTFGYSSRLWRQIWILSRLIGCVPRKDPLPVKVKLNRGILMHLNLSRLTDALAFSFGIGESEIGYLASKVCLNDSIILDIGANIGTSSLFFSKLVPNGWVHVFEPSNSMRSELLNNINANNIKNATIYPFGLGNENTKGILMIAMEGNPGSAYFVKANDNQSDALDIKVLDEVFEPGRRIDLIKIDVEGYETKVLMGAKENIMKSKPIIIIENNEPALKRAGSSSKELAEWLINKNYEIYKLVSGKLIKLSDKDFQRGIFNLVAIEKSRTILLDIFEIA